MHKLDWYLFDESVKQRNIWKRALKEQTDVCSLAKDMIVRSRNFPLLGTPRVHIYYLILKNLHQNINSIFNREIWIGTDMIFSSTFLSEVSQVPAEVCFASGM